MKQKHAPGKCETASCCVPPICPFLTCAALTRMCTLTGITLGDYTFPDLTMSSGDWQACALPAFVTPDYTNYDYCSYEYLGASSTSATKQVDASEYQLLNYTNTGSCLTHYNNDCNGNYDPIDIYVTHNNDWVVDGTWYWRAREYVVLAPSYIVFRKHKTTGQVSIATQFSISFHYCNSMWWLGSVESTYSRTGVRCPPEAPVVCTWNSTQTAITCTPGTSSSGTIETSFVDESACAITQTHSSTVSGYDIAYTSRQLQTLSVTQPTPNVLMQTVQTSGHGLCCRFCINPNPCEVGSIYAITLTLQRFDLTATSQDLDLTFTTCT